MKKNLFLHAICIMGCIACGIILCAAQTSFFPHYINDAFFVPDVLLCITVGIAVTAGRYGHIYGTLFGIFAGILADSTAGCGIFLLPLFYMLCAYGAYVCNQLIPNKKLLIYLSLGTISAALRTLVALVYVFLSAGSVPIPDIARYVCIPLFLGTVLALLFMYPASLLLTLPIRKINHQNIDKFT